MRRFRWLFVWGSAASVRLAFIRWGLLLSLGQQSHDCAEAQFVRRGTCLGGCPDLVRVAADHGQQHAQGQRQEGEGDERGVDQLET